MSTTLYRIAKRVIENGKKAGTLDKADMSAKLDGFYMASKLTGDEYAELTRMLS